MPHYANEKSSSREITIESKTLMDDAHETITAEFRIAQKEFATKGCKRCDWLRVQFMFSLLSHMLLLWCAAQGVDKGSAFNVLEEKLAWRAFYDR